MTVKSSRPAEPKPPNPVKNQQSTKGKGKGKGKGNHNGGGMYGAYAGYKGVSRGRAKHLVDAEINPLLRDFAHEIQTARRQGQSTIRDLRHVYDESGDFLKHQQGQVRNSFQDFSQQQQAAKAALMQQMQAQNQNVMGQTGNELQRLGLGQQFTQQMAADQANQVNLANQQMGNVQSTADLMKLGAMNMARSLQGMNSGQQAASIGQAQNNRDTAIFDLRRDRRDLSQQRPELMRQMLEQMAAQGWGQYVDQRNLQQQQQSLNMQRQAQAFAQHQAGAQNAQQNAYNSTLSSLMQQQLQNTYPNRRP